MLQSARGDRKVHLAKVFGLLQRRKCMAKSVDGKPKAAARQGTRPDTVADDGRRTAGPERLLAAN
jgi:hypothetical protein